MVSDSVPQPQPLRIIDLNADLGEGFPNDEAILDRVTSAGISCGAHAGDRAICLETIAVATRKGVVIGAHPGYPDREGFGRRERNVSAGEVARIVGDQLAQFESWAIEAGARVRFVKPHGALYNQAQRNPEVAAGIVQAVLDQRLPVLGLPGSVLQREAQRAGLVFVAEGFVDRRYQEDGSLVPRSEPSAVIDTLAEAELQAMALIDRGLQTLCVHGDDPRALVLADRLRSALARAGVVLRGFVGEEGL